MLASITEKFVINEVQPVFEDLKNKDLKTSVKLIKRAGNLGLLDADIFEKGGGLDFDKVG